VGHNIYIGNAPHIGTHEPFIRQYVLQAAKAKGKGFVPNFGTFMYENDANDVEIVAYSCVHTIGEGDNAINGYPCPRCTPSLYRQQQEQQEHRAHEQELEAQPQRPGYAAWTFPTKGKGKKGLGKGTSDTTGSNGRRSRSWSRQRNGTRSTSGSSMD